MVIPAARPRYDPAHYRKLELNNYHSPTNTDVVDLSGMDQSETDIYPSDLDKVEYFPTEIIDKMGMERYECLYK